MLIKKYFLRHNFAKELNGLISFDIIFFHHLCFLTSLYERFFLLNDRAEQMFPEVGVEGFIEIKDNFLLRITTKNLQSID